jgi:hypothetical protein
VAVSGNYAYVADGSSGLRIINITNPAAPTLAGFFDTPGYSYGVAVRGNYAYVADGSSLRIIDVTNPAAPTQVGYWVTPGSAENVAVRGNYAYVVNESSGLRIIDITYPAEPAEVGFYNTLYNCVSVAVAGNYAFVGVLSTGLQVINVSNPSQPVEAGRYDTPSCAYGVAAAGSTIYVADWSYFGIYEFSPCAGVIPPAPQIVVQPAGQSVRLSWNPIEQSENGCPVAVTHYLVFYSPTNNGPYYYHGFTTDTTYVHAGVIQYAPGMFYQVVASTGSPPTLQELPEGGVLTMEEALARLKE